MRYTMRNRKSATRRSSPLMIISNDEDIPDYRLQVNNTSKDEEQEG
ncbi:MAG: hypothetical protein MZV63_47490 [Marinilabiliales bacterium]|nr:hypothetical protein [Marinilabiliales bacterium]